MPDHTETPNRPQPTAGPLASPHAGSFWLLLIGRSVSLLGDAVIPAALAIAVTRATEQASALAFVLACAMTPRLLLLPVGGLVADRIAPQRVALVTDLVRCATQLFTGLLLLHPTPGLGPLAAAQAVGGCAAAFALPAAVPLVAGVVPASPGRQRANALLGVATTTTRLAGPALAGLMIFTVGPGWAFLTDAATFAVSAALTAALRTHHHPVPRRSLRRDLAEGWSEVRSRDWYLISLIAHGVWNTAAAVLASLGPIVAHQRLGGDGVWVAMLESGVVGMLLGSLLAVRVRPRRPVLLANLGLASFAVPLTLLAVAAPVPLVVTSNGLALAALGFLKPVWETVVQENFPAHALARVTSYDWLVSLAGAPIGYILAPLAADLWGPALPLSISAALVAAACLSTAAFPGVRQLGAPAVRTSAPKNPLRQIFSRANYTGMDHAISKSPPGRPAKRNSHERP